MKLEDNLSEFERKTTVQESYKSWQLEARNKEKRESRAFCEHLHRERAGVASQKSEEAHEYQGKHVQILEKRRKKRSSVSLINPEKSGKLVVRLSFYCQFPNNDMRLLICREPPF